MITSILLFASSALAIRYEWYWNSNGTIQDPKWERYDATVEQTIDDAYINHPNNEFTILNNRFKVNFVDQNNYDAKQSQAVDRSRWRHIKKIPVRYTWSYNDKQQPWVQNEQGAWNIAPNPVWKLYDEEDQERLNGVYARNPAQQGFLLSTTYGVHFYDRELINQKGYHGIQYRRDNEEWAQRQIKRERFEWYINTASSPWNDDDNQYKWTRYEYQEEGKLIRAYITDPNQENLILNDNYSVTFNVRNYIGNELYTGLQKHRVHSGRFRQIKSKKIDDANINNIIVNQAHYIPHINNNIINQPNNVAPLIEDGVLYPDKSCTGNNSIRWRREGGSSLSRGVCLEWCRGQTQSGCCEYWVAEQPHHGCSFFPHGNMQDKDSSYRRYYAALMTNQNNNNQPQNIIHHQQNQNNNMIEPPMEDDVPEDLKCCVCLGRKKNLAFTPCGHVATCKYCFTKLETKKCPLCRKKIESTLVVYL